MQGEHAGLGAKTEECQQKSACRPSAAARKFAHGLERIVAGAAGHDAKRQQNADGADVGDQQIKISGAPNLGVAMLGRNEKKRGQRHRFPGDHEGVTIICQ